jgi:hypothetical protein
MWLERGREGGEGLSVGVVWRHSENFLFIKAQFVSLIKWFGECIGSRIFVSSSKKGSLTLLAELEETRLK